MAAVDADVQSWARRVSGFWRDYKWPLVLVLVVLALGLGLWGSWWYYADKYATAVASGAEGERASGADIMFLTLQLFTINATIEPGPKNLPLCVAMFVAPLVTVFFGVMALIGIYREQFQILWMRWYYNRHTVICGIGRNGLQLIKDLARKRRVVAMDEDEENDLVVFARDYGAVVMIGDATDQKSLAKARVDRAAELFALCGTDLPNLVIAARAAALAERRSVPLEAHIHISDLNLWDLFRRQNVFPNANGMFRAHFFNVYANAARLAFDRYPLEPEGYGPRDQRIVHLVVLGFGHMGESVAVQALKIGHFCNANRLHITVLDRDAKNLERVFQARYRQAYRVGSVDFQECEVDGAVVCKHLDTSFKEQILNVAVCLDDDSRSLALGMELLELLDKRAFSVRVRMAQEPGFQTLTAESQPGSSITGRLCVFGMIDHICTAENIVQGELDLLAREVHEAFRQPRLKKLSAAQKADLPANLRPWEELDEDLRDFNRQQADHIPVKLRALNCYAAAKPREAADQEVTALDEETEVKPLAKVEHNRWRASYFMAGWDWGPEKRRDLKRHWCLIPWEELPALDEKLRREGKKPADEDSFQENGRKAIRNIPHLLKAIGKRVYRRAKPQQSGSGWKA